VGSRVWLDWGAYSRKREEKREGRRHGDKEGGGKKMWKIHNNEKRA